MKALIFGGRNFHNQSVATCALDQLHEEFAFTTVIDGMAHGADTLGHRWAVSRKIATERYPALWNKYGRAAGPVRNQQMLDEGKPDIAVAFPGGTGTTDMTKRCLKHGVLVKYITIK